MTWIDIRDAGAPRDSEKRAENVFQHHRDERALRWDEDVRSSKYDAFQWEWIPQ